MNKINKNVPWHILDAERGRLRQTLSSRECASLAGRAFLCTREFQRNFLVHKKRLYPFGTEPLFTNLVF